MKLAFYLIDILFLRPRSSYSALQSSQVSSLAPTKVEWVRSGGYLIGEGWGGGTEGLVTTTFEIGKISLKSPIVINVPTTASLAVKTKGLLFLWLAQLNNKSNFCEKIR